MFHLLCCYQDQTFQDQDYRFQDQYQDQKVQDQDQDDLLVNTTTER